MSDKKRRIEIITFFDAHRISKKLEAMAKKGWMLESIGSYIWTYRKIEPQAIHFAVTYYAKASGYDPGPSPKQLEYQDMAAHTGWKLAASSAQMQVFYNIEENPIPLETEPALEIATIHKSAMRNFIPGNAFVLLLAAFQGFIQFSAMKAYPITFWSSTSSLVSVAAIIVLFLITAVNLGAYFIWHHKAAADAKQDIFRNYPNLVPFNICSIVFLIILLFTWIMCVLLYGSSFEAAVTIGTVFLVLVITVITIGLRDVMKERNVSANKNRAVSIVFIIGITIALSFGIVHSAVILTDDSMFSHNTEIPVSVSELLDVDADDYDQDVSGTESIFLADYWMDDTPDGSKEGAEELPYISYKVVLVKADFIYDMCWADMKETYSEQELRDTDAALWHAEAAYCISDTEYNEDRWFLLCFDDKFVIVYPSWNLTDDQKELIGERFAAY